MKKLRKVLSVVMAFILLATGIQVSGLTVDAETEWTETAITSLKYEVTVENSVSDGDAVESFDWTTVDGNWSTETTTVALDGDGDYTIEVASDSASGMINLGYITQIADSAMTVTVNKVVVNGYEMAYETAPVLKANSSWENALVNIWSGLESGTQICSGDNAYLAFDGDASLIKLYVAQNTSDSNTGNEGNDETVETEAEWVETAITSLKYEITVANTSSETEFVWEALDDNSSWAASTATVALNGDGDYSFEIAASAVAGMRNLGYVSTIADSEMTVTINKIIVNGYELTYETAPVLYAGTDYSNGLVNIWSGLESGVAICGSDSAYLAFDSVASLIKFYAKQEKTDESQWTEAAITSVKYEVTVANTSSETEFVWEALDDNSSWAASTATVALNGDGDYSFEIAASAAAGMRNLGYVSTIADSEMTITINKIIVNGYELTYETAPVLYAGTDYSNGLVNIWSGLESGVAICGSDDAYLAYDADASLIKFYTKQASGSGDSDDVIISESASLDYVKAMGDGWNLGNSFDGVNTALDEVDEGEEAWGNPEVVKELIQAVKAKGYDSIRMPLTLYRRYDEETYKIDETWLARYKEVVQWAVDEGLYVMINIHHDSWIWLSAWDGNTESEEYVKYTALWEQLASYFADMPEQVMFETINEPNFVATGDITTQNKLDAVNLAAYNAIRNSGGNNTTRMIVIPTFLTNHAEGYCDATVSFMEALNDENLVATVHYYSEWVHSAGIGKTGFDEVLWQNNGEDYTPRDSVDLFFETLQKKFLNKGIGVVVGEWGLLGYDSASQVNQAGEELKYYEYMNYYANETDVCLMFWDNGSGIDRESGTYNWKKPLVGEMLETSMNERSAYVTDLDRVFLTEETEEDLSFPLTLNGLTFVGIEGLTEGTDYTYDEASATVTLSKDYVNTKFAAMGDEYGTFAELVFQFSGGADWHEYLIKYATAVASETTGTVSNIKIPVDFKGSEVRRATAYMASGKVGPNSSWWDYLQYGGAFLPDYETGTIAVLSGFWNDSTVVDGAITFHFEMYDGSVMKYTLEKDGENVIGYPAVDSADAVFECATEICVYVGETEIKDTYFNIPKGTSVYGTYTKPESAPDYVTLTGWPATMTFGTEAQEESIIIGLRFDYLDRIEYAEEITFWLKDAPVVEAVTVDEGSTASVVVNNLAENATVTYEVADTAVATVAADGTLKGVEAGTTKVIATITQYGRTDSFEANVTVNKVEAPEVTATPAPTAAPEVTEAPATEEGEIIVPVDPDNACGAQIKDFADIKDKINLTDDEKEAIKKGADLKVLLKVLFDGISEDDKDKIKDALDGFKLGTYLNIDLFKQIGDGQEVGIEKLSGEIDIIIKLPKELINTDEDETRTYKVLRLHDGKVDVLDAVYDEKEQTLSFKTDRFSTYAVVYSDKDNSDDKDDKKDDTIVNTILNAISPKMGDDNNGSSWALFGVLGVVCAVAAVAGVTVLRKKEEE